MSITDPVVFVETDKWGGGYMLEQGRETFYDPETREIMVWRDPENAVRWLEIHYPEKVSRVVWPEGLKEYLETYDRSVFEPEDQPTLKGFDV